MANQVAYGFLNLTNLFAERITSTNQQEVSDAIAVSVAEHNRQMDAMIALFAERTTAYSLRYAQIGANRLQPLDENGRARPVLPAGYYDVGFPIRDAGTAWGATFKAKELMTVGDANRITAMMTNGDTVWMRDQILAALFSNTSYTYTDEDFGAVTVQTLANNDTVTYQRNGSLAFSADTHQYGQAAAIADATDPYDDIVTELTEHPENSGDVIVFIASDLVATTRALTAFYEVEDPDITLGTNTARLTGSFGTSIPGQLLGKHSAGAWIAEWSSLPSGYFVATTTGGRRPLAMREYPAASLQGFVQIPDPRIDHPFYEQQYVRYAGFGALNRVGAMVGEVSDASYDVPTGYTAPIS
jgi:hypothetical protein